MSILPNENILWLQIPIDNIDLVEVLERGSHFGGIEFGDCWGEANRFADEGEEFATSDKVHHHEQVVLVLERAPEVDEEGVFT